MRRGALLAMVCLWAAAPALAETPAPAERSPTADSPLFIAGTDLTLVSGPRISFDRRAAVAEDHPEAFLPLPTYAYAALSWPLGRSFALGPRAGVLLWQTEGEGEMGYPPHFSFELGVEPRVWLTPGRYMRLFVSLPLGLALDYLGSRARFSGDESISAGLGFHFGLSAGALFAPQSTHTGYVQLAFSYRRLSYELAYEGTEGEAAYTLVVQPLALHLGVGVLFGL